MRALSKWIAAFLSTLLLLAALCVRVNAQEWEPSAGEAVLEVSSGRVLWEKDGERILPMASTTKILTAITIIEDCDLDAIVCVPAECVGVEGSSVYLVAGEKLTVRDLLYGLMLRSGNDCAETLACHHSGSVGAFAACMNERAAAYGACNSRFVNPHGLPAEGHETTALDLARIAVHALRNETFRTIVSSKMWRVEDGGCGYARVWQNKNKMLYNYAGADGVKTGYTVAAGRCLVTSATRDGMQLASVVLNSPSMYERSGEILDAGFAQYSMQNIFDASSYVRSMPTDVRGKECRVGCRQSVTYPLRADEAEQIRVREVLPPRLNLPVREGDVVGELQITLANQLIFSQEIVSIENKQKSYLDILRQLMLKRTENSLCASTNISPNAA